MIQTIALTKKFDQLRALDAVELNFTKGGIHALVGSNGSG